MQLLLQKESDSVEYYEMLLSQNENQRILIHDIKNIFYQLNYSMNRIVQKNRYLYSTAYEIF